MAANMLSWTLRRTVIDTNVLAGALREHPPIRLPEVKHARLRRLAHSRRISMNKLIDELATVALAQHDAELRFHALAARGSAPRGLALLDKLDQKLRRQ